MTTREGQQQDGDGDGDVRPAVLHEIEQGGSANKVRERERGARKRQAAAADLQRCWRQRRLTCSDVGDGGDKVAASGGTIKTKVSVSGEENRVKKKKKTYKGSFVIKF